MRKLKFRAWVKDKKKMYDVTGYLEQYLMLGEGDYQRHYTSLIVMQYTGFTDEDGVEIYEGDILLCDEVTYSESNEQTTRYVKFSKGGYYGAYINEKIGNNTVIGSFLEDVVFYGCKVIGNIFENEELLAKIEFQE